MKQLKTIYQTSFLIGNIYTPKVLEDEALHQLLKTQFNALTAENIMKPALIQPKQATFTFDAADAMVDYASDHDFHVVGHTLAWHQQTLDWIDEAKTSREEALNLLREHLMEIMTRYKGKIISWDVLNEAIEDGVQQDTKAWRKHLRDTPWLRMIGEDYIQHVFHIAHELDPHAILYYNDYNLNNQQKREATYYMVKELKEAGVPIQGIGMQGHYHTNTPVQTVEESLALFTQLDGIEISVTELDVTVTGSEKATVLSTDHEIEQAQYYAQLFQIYKRYENSIKRITFWGTDDATSWRRERFPTLFNQDYSPKQAFHAIVDPDQFLKDHPLVERDTTQTAVATHGSPVLGVVQTWHQKHPLSVSRQLTAWEGATAKAYVMWDEVSLYLLADVSVATLNASAKEIHHKDSVDIYLNLMQEQSKNDQTDDHHITITFENEVSFNGKVDIKGFKSFATTTNNGYQVQVKIPVQKGLFVEQVIGFDLQVNDSNAHGVRQSMATWNDVSGRLGTSTAGFGKLRLTCAD
ncbi:MAG: endo-1,4-beta-xylanase [Defluviitaleaceae bacterium]|nr:endo-1,4-beta-xylanase [Defluviitaleaceae bacterium]